MGLRLFFMVLLCYPDLQFPKNIFCVMSDVHKKGKKSPKIRETVLSGSCELHIPKVVPCVMHALRCIVFFKLRKMPKGDKYNMEKLNMVLSGNIILP